MSVPCHRGSNPDQGIDWHWCSVHNAEWLLGRPTCSAVTERREPAVVTPGHIIAAVTERRPALDLILRYRDQEVRAAVIDEDRLARALTRSRGGRMLAENERDEARVITDAYRRIEP